MTRILESLGLAFDILKGGLRLLKRYPILIVPLLPVFFMVLGLEVALIFFIQDLFPALILVFVVAFELMFSFAITSNMIQQIHEGKRPSIADAITSSKTVGLIPKVVLLSIVWFTLILIIVAIELAISALLSRGNNGSERVKGFINSIFGTAADALRLMGFMMIPIMIFEDVGLRQGFKRLKATLTENPITALSGLALTKLSSALIGLVIVGIGQLVESINFVGFLVIIAVMAVGWVFSMYLEQIFVTGLYLYSAFPESKVIGILLEKHIGRELPRLPTPKIAGQPLTS